MLLNGASPSLLMRENIKAFEEWPYALLESEYKVEQYQKV